jgi:Flp pilus assembly protein TadD
MAMVAAVALVSWACAPASPYRSASPDRRDPSRAAQLTQQAAEILDADPAGSEKLLREALALDLFHGPAHNNLGVIHLRRGELYQAASEFEWARKLMPGHPDPRVNLAMTLETAGRTDEALDTYRSALDTAGANLPAMQGLARLQVRTGRTDAQTAQLLSTIALEGESNAWRDWAKLTHTRLTRPGRHTPDALPEPTPAPLPPDGAAR